MTVVRVLQKQQRDDIKVWLNSNDDIVESKEVTVNKILKLSIILVTLVVAMGSTVIIMPDVFSFFEPAYLETVFYAILSIIQVSFALTTGILTIVGGVTIILLAIIGLFIAVIYGGIKLFSTCLK